MLMSDPKHPLYGCLRRIQRSNRYIEETERLMEEFATECEECIAGTYDAQSGRYLELVDFPDIPDDLPLAISDAVHNLRAALDYLVYELALYDSGSIQEGTQFPLEIYKLHTLPAGNKIGFD